MQIECKIMKVQQVDELITLLWLQPMVENAPPIPYPVYCPKQEYYVGQLYGLDFARLCAEYNSVVYIARQYLQNEAMR